MEDNCNEYLISYFTDLYVNRSDDYANGRDVRNYFEKVVNSHANRVMQVGISDCNQLQLIDDEDLTEL